VATAILFHDKSNDRNQLLHFEKDLAIAGGLLVLFARGAGAWALDAWRAKRPRVSSGETRSTSPPDSGIPDTPGPFPAAPA